MSWKDALVDYAKTPDPSELPPEVLLMSTDNTISIWDKFPKAMFHFLVLPRLPFQLPEPTQDVSQTTLNSLSSLISNKHGLAVLKILKYASLEASGQAWTS